MVEKEQDKKKVNDRKYELVEVPTETALAIKDNSNDSIILDKEILVRILNTVEEINKKL